MSEEKKNPWEPHHVIIACIGFGILIVIAPHIAIPAIIGVFLYRAAGFGK